MARASRASRAAQARLRVDAIACDGRGLCAELLPELITVDDWGFPIIGAGAVPASLMDDARTTVLACPKLALRLDRMSGSATGSRRRRRPPALESPDDLPRKRT